MSWNEGGSSNLHNLFEELFGNPSPGWGEPIMVRPEPDISDILELIKKTRNRSEPLPRPLMGSLRDLRRMGIFGSWARKIIIALQVDVDDPFLSEPNRVEILTSYRRNLFGSSQGEVWFGLYGQVPTGQEAYQMLGQRYEKEWRRGLSYAFSEHTFNIIGGNKSPIPNPLVRRGKNRYQVNNRAVYKALEIVQRTPIIRTL